MRGGDGEEGERAGGAGGGSVGRRKLIFTYLMLRERGTMQGAISVSTVSPTRHGRVRRTACGRVSCPGERPDNGTRNEMARRLPYGCEDQANVGGPGRGRAAGRLLRSEKGQARREVRGASYGRMGNAEAGTRAMRILRRREHLPVPKRTLRAGRERRSGEGRWQAWW